MSYYIAKNYYSTPLEYTVFKSNPIYDYLSIFISKIFFVESDIVVNNQQNFKEVYDLFNNEELKKFNFISVSIQPKRNSSLILSELNMSSKLTAKDLDHFKHIYNKQSLSKPEYKKFLSLMIDLFGFKNIHEGGLLWFEPYIHGYKVKFMSAKKFITNSNPKYLKETILNNCDIDRVLKEFNIEVEKNKNELDRSDSDIESLNFKNEIPSVTVEYTRSLEQLKELQNADYQKETSIEEVNNYFKAVLEVYKSFFKGKIRNKGHKLEIRYINWICKLYVPGIEEEITMLPVAKSFYFLTLINLGGIRIDELWYYENELQKIYLTFSKREHLEDMRNTITKISQNPKRLAIQKTRAKDGFKEVVCPKYELPCEEIIKELVYVSGTSNLKIELLEEEIGGYENLDRIFKPVYR